MRCLPLLCLVSLLLPRLRQNLTSSSIQKAFLSLSQEAPRRILFISAMSGLGSHPNSALSILNHMRTIWAWLLHPRPRHLRRRHELLNPLLRLHPLRL